MSETPDIPEAPDTPAEREKRKRTRLQALAFFGGMAVAILAMIEHKG